MFCSIIICHIPMRQGFLLTLEVDWQLASRRDLLGSSPHLLGLVLGLQHVPCQQPPLYLGTEDLNSGPYAYAANALIN